MPKSFVYILKSLKDRKHYIGYASNLDKRLKQHKNGDNISTKYRGRLDLIYSEETPSIAKAVEKERYIKQLGVKRFLDKVL